MIVLDSGLGGISVVRALRAMHPPLPITYVADTAGFPYGSQSAEAINARAKALVKRLVAEHPATPIVLACNTLSTLCLEPLRATFSVPFVGTVPAIKTAAQQSRSRRFTLLATPNTANSVYSRNLIDAFAKDCVVDSYGAPHLAQMAEAMMLGENINEEALRNEIRPAFIDDAKGKTDSIVLGCTHYPLIGEALSRVAPWPVAWIDSSDAIAKRALTLSDTPSNSLRAYVTAAADVERYRDVFLREGFEDVCLLAIA